MEQAGRFELLIGRKGTIAFPPGPQVRAVDDLPGVPVLAATLLKMELELHESSTDLRAFSEVVLGDMGATIQILRIVGREYGAASDRPARVEDCISALGPRACLNATASGPFIRGIRQRASVEMWAHARETAQYFKLLAAQSSSSIHPDQAYLAGLLHSLGALPAVLDWGGCGISGGPARVALEMAELWHLPRYVREFFSEVLMPGHSPEWSQFITIGHHPAKESWAECPLTAAPSLAVSSANR